MNLVAKMLHLSQPQQDTNKQSILSMAQGIRSGAVDVKSECLRLLNSMNREQRRQLASAFPAFAKRQGMTDSDINAFMQNINF